MSNDWFFIALLAPAIWAIVNIIDDNLMRQVYKSPFIGTIISGVFALLPLISLFFVPITIPSTMIIVIAFLSGFLLISSYWFYFKSLSIDTPSVVIVLWATTPALVPFLAYIFLKEVLSPLQYLGFALILAASLGISLIDVKKIKLSQTFYYMIFASVLYALSSVGQKYVYQFVDFWSGFLFVTMGMGLGALFFTLSFEEGKQFLREIKRYQKFFWIFLGSEILNILAVFLSSLAISRGPVSLVKVIEGTQPIYVLLFALLFYPFFPKYFREAAARGKTKKFLAMGIVLAGLYFIYRS